MPSVFAQIDTQSNHRYGGADFELFVRISGRITRTPLSTRWRPIRSDTPSMRSVGAKVGLAHVWVSKHLRCAHSRERCMLRTVLDRARVSAPRNRGAGADGRRGCLRENPRSR